MFSVFPVADHASTSVLDHRRDIWENECGLSLQSSSCAGFLCAGEGAGFPEGGLCSVVGPFSPLSPDLRLRR